MSKGIENVEQKIEDQKPALEPSEWADPPELEEQYAAPEDDNTNEQPAGKGEDPKPSEETEQPADEIPAGEDAMKSGDEGGTKEEAAEPEFDPVLLRAAGFESEDQAKAQFGTPQALRNAVRLLDQRAVNIAQQGQQAPPQQRQQQPPEQQQQTPNPAEAAAEFKMPEPPEGEEWDEATEALVKSLHEQFNQRLQQQQQALEQQRQATETILQERQQAELKRYVEEFDGFVSELGDDWEMVLGKGSGFELPPDSIHLQNRIHLDTIAKQIAQGREVQGLPELSRRDLMERALYVAFPDKQEQAVRKQVETEVGQRQRMVTNRPVNRGSKKEKSGEESAASRAEKWYADRGMPSMPGDDFDYDTI